MVVCSYCLEGDSAYRLGVEGSPGAISNVCMCTFVFVCLSVCVWAAGV